MNADTSKHPIRKTRYCVVYENQYIEIDVFPFSKDKAILEIPAGKLEKGEDPLESGKRELLEEVGATAKKITSLGKLYPSPGYCGEIISMFLAEGLEFSSQNLYFS